MPSERLRARVVELADPSAWEAVMPTWSAFVSRSGVRCGFWCHPEVLQAFEAQPGSLRLLALVSVEDGGDIVAMLPFRLEDQAVPIYLGLRRLGAIRARIGRLFDFDFAAICPADRLATLRVAADELARRCGCDAVLGQNCAWNPRSSVRGLVWCNVQDTFVLELPDGFECLMRSMSAKSRQTVGRKVRKAQAALPGLRCECYREPARMGELSRILTHVWQRSWHGRVGRQQPPPEKVLTRLAELRAVRAYVLTASADCHLATVLGYQWNGTFYDEAPAFDQNWASLSPGLVLDYFMLQNLVAVDPPRVVDFGFGYNQYKEVFGNRRETRGQVWIPLSRRGWQLVFLASIAERFFRLAAPLLRRTGVLRRIKARMRTGT